MKKEKRQALWARLKAAGLVRGEDTESPPTPWYVSAMLGVAGWIGASFMLGFVGALFEALFRSPGALALIAGVCCGAAFLVFRCLPRSAFSGQFGLAIGITGQALFAAAIFNHFPAKEAAGFLAFFAVEAALTALMPNFLHRTISSLVGACALALWLAQIAALGLALPLLALGCALIWRNEVRLAQWWGLWHPAGYGLALALLCSTAALSQVQGLLFAHGSKPGWLAQHAADTATLLVSAVVLGVVLSVLREQEIDPLSATWNLALGCAVLALAVSFPAHGLAAAALLLILGFGGGNRFLAGLGVLALICFLIVYYYQMQQTLLVKSLILAGTGAVLLTVRWVVATLLPAEEA